MGKNRAGERGVRGKLTESLNEVEGHARSTEMAIREGPNQAHR